MERVSLTFAMVFLGCALLQGQSTAPAERGSKPKASDAAKPELQDLKSEPNPGAKPLTLENSGRSSPEEAARIAAKSLAQQKNGGGDDQPAAAQGENESKPAGQSTAATDNAVVEFQPAGDGAEKRSTAAATVQDKGSKPSRKRVHGDLYGARSGLGHADGGSVGGTSKSGRTSVYVESDHARSQVP